MRKKRVYYLDNARGLSLLCVIIGHIYNCDNIFVTWIYSFHVPLFFMISGSLLYYKNSVNKKFSSLFISKVKSILIPYIMFCCINIIFEQILNNSVVTLNQDILQTLTLFGIGATWFLPVLFISEIIFIVINKYINNKFIKFILTSILCVIPFIFNSNCKIVTVTFRSLTALAYISIGNWIFKYINKVNISWLKILCILGISILLAKINGNVDLYSLRYNNPIIYLLCGVMGSSLILIILKKIRKIKTHFLRYIGLNSIVIMATHQIIIRTWQSVFNNNLEDFFAKTMLLISIFILEVPLIYLVNNYLSFMLGKSRPKRWRVIKTTFATS